MPKSSRAAVHPSVSTRYRLVRELRRKHNEENQAAINGPLQRNADAEANGLVAPREEADRLQGAHANDLGAPVNNEINRLEDEPNLAEQGQDIDENADEDLVHENEGIDEADIPEAGAIEDDAGIFNAPIVGEVHEGGDSSDEEGIDNQDDDAFLNAFGNRRLYRDAPVSVGETAALLITCMINHSLTQSAVEDIMTIISLVCPREDFVKLSIYKLQKYFKFVPGPHNKKYYCTVCYQALDNEQVMCPVCEMRRPVSYFIQCPLAPQLENMFARPGFYASLQQRFNRQGRGLADIYDGILYKEYLNFLAERSNISFTFYTDGVPVLGKGSTFWGFFLTINELPYKERIKRENTLLAGLWFGKCKPDPNLFMMSFVDDFRRLYNVGLRIHVEGYGRIRVRCFVLAGVGDIPAKSSFLNCVAHNGMFGCTVCENPGLTYNLPGGSHTHAYAYDQGAHKRTSERMVMQAREAVAIRARRYDENVMGVKGPSALKLFIVRAVTGTIWHIMIQV